MRTCTFAVVSVVMLGLSVTPLDATAENVSLLGHGGGSSSGVVVSGQYAYVVEYCGLNVLDISTPGAPVLRGHLLLPDSADHAGGLAVSGNRVYVPWSSGMFTGKSAKAAMVGGFRVIDVSNPASPQLIASYAAPGAVTGLAARGNIVYLPWGGADLNAFTFWGGFQVLDMSVPSAPVVLGQCDTGASMGVSLDGNKAYIPRVGGMAIVDITSSASPTVLGAYASGAVVSVSWDVALAGTTAFFVQVKTMNLSTCSYTLEAVSVSNPAAPALLGSCTLSSFDSVVLDVMALVLSGSRAFVANNQAGLQVVDLANAASPQLLKSYLMPSEVLGVGLSGSTAYLACGKAGLEVVNMTDPANPIRLRSCLGGGTGRVFVTDQQAYTCWEEGFHKGSIWRNSGGIRIASVPGMGVDAAVDMPGKTTSVVATDTRAYAVWRDDEAGTKGVEVYDVHAPATPARLGTYTPSITPSYIAANGNVVYIADMWGVFSIIDLADIANPQVLTPPYSMNPNIDRLYLEGNILYAWSGLGLTVLDVSNPQSPVQLKQFALDVLDVKRQGNTTFLLDQNVLAVYDSTFNHGFASNAVPANSIAVSGRLGYLGTTSGVTVVDLINPAAPVVLGSYDYAPLEAGRLGARLACENGNAYLSDMSRGLFALRYSGPLASNLRSQFDDQWVALCGLAGLSPDNADVNGDGLPERWALRLIQTVLDSANAPLHETACTAYIDNLVEIGLSGGAIVQQNRECIAALLMMGSDIRDYAQTRFGLTGTYHVATGEPFSGAGDLDSDGVSNAQECAAVAGRGGTIDTFVDMAVYRYGAGPLPVAGLIGLGALLSLIGIAGAGKLRRISRKG